MAKGPAPRQDRELGPKGEEQLEWLHSHTHTHAGKVWLQTQHKSQLKELKFCTQAQNPKPPSPSCHSWIQGTSTSSTSGEMLLVYEEGLEDTQRNRGSCRAGLQSHMCCITYLCYPAPDFPAMLLAGDSLNSVRKHQAMRGLSPLPPAL